jgi:hypothetical protein
MDQDESKSTDGVASGGAGQFGLSQESAAKYLILKHPRILRPEEIERGTYKFVIKMKHPCRHPYEFNY